MSNWGVVLAAPAVALSTVCAVAIIAISFKTPGNFVSNSEHESKIKNKYQEKGYGN